MVRCTAAEAVAQGNFTAPIVVDGADEVGVLLGSLQQMRTALVQQMSALEAQATSLQVLLDSTGDALLPVGRDGGVQAGISTITKAWFGDVAPGTRVWDYLFGTHVSEAIAFEVAFEQMSDDVLPFELLADQMPSRLRRGEREFKIEFRRIGGAELEAVLIIVRDVTALIQCARRAP